MWEPFGTLSTNATASWRSGPNDRGTLNILSTCLITLILCVYTCVHVDIPEHGKTHWAQVLKRKLLWLIPGLFAPEIVTFTAFRQWYFARNLEVRMKKLLDPLLAQKSDVGSAEDPSDSPPASSSTRLHPWTRLHSHYALMGGFVFDTSKAPVNFLPEGRTRVTLTPIALRRLASHQPDLIPDIDEDDIREKSKADGFAKSIVCFQATWFIILVSGRLAAKYPISLLELNTFLHALCCLGIYMAWWNKPLDIQRPSLIDASKDPVRKLCAWMIMQSALGSAPHCYGKSRLRNIYRSYSGSFRHLLYEEDMVEDSNESKWHVDAKNALVYLKEQNALKSQTEDTDPHPRNTSSRSTSNKNGDQKLFSGQEIHGFRLICTYESNNPDQDVWTELSAANIECLRLAQAFREDHKQDQDWKLHPWDEFKRELNYVVAFASARSYSSRNCPTDQELKIWAVVDEDNSKGIFSKLFEKMKKSIISFVFGLIGVSSIYGSIHLLAWNGPFSSATDRLLWRLSALYLSATFPVTIIGCILISIPDLVKSLVRLHAPRLSMFLERLKKRVINAQAVRYLEPLLVLGGLVALLAMLLVAFLIVVCYCLARAFLVVESFRGLACLPDKVYQEPEWVQFFAHIGAG